MEFPVGVFEGFLDAFHILHNVHGPDHIHVHFGGVAHQAYNGLLGAYGDVRGDAHALKPGGQTVQLLLGGVFLEKHYHFTTDPFSYGTKKRPRCEFRCGAALALTQGINRGRGFLQQNSNKPYQKS